MRKITLLLFVLVSCQYDPGTYQSSSITANKFIKLLNEIDNEENDSIFFSYESVIEKNVGETVRGHNQNQNDWFVIWDDFHSEHIAISLQYLRSIKYYSLVGESEFRTVSEFREMTIDDESFGGLGDGDGYEYEIVDFEFSNIFGEDFYRGTDSHLLYEDGEEIYDVSLLQGEQETISFFKKASRVSTIYSINIQSALSLVSLAENVEKLLVDKNQVLSKKDQESIFFHLSKSLGVSPFELKELDFSDTAESHALLEKISENIGTSPKNLKEIILPKIF